MISDKKRRLSAEREAFEKVLGALIGLNIRTPKRGWIKAVREMLGMSVTQLGKRTKLNPTTISRLESNEVKEVITLTSLKKLANALECDVCYALIPRKPFIDILEERAALVIKNQLTRTEGSMSLENQGGGDISAHKLTARKAILVETLDKRLWNDK